ncbi:helix-turn-helix domain-containing protein [Nostoc sp.]|uniref:helix-turn-helix domain-containing protein n=1 Tax=Nostoc sp. TaxID=1180 RepID=UPI002FFD12F1
MSGPFQIEISESLEELEKALRYATSGSSKERLQMLYWLKSGQVTSRRSLAERLRRDQATITRWLRKYKHGGHSSLLEVKHALLSSAHCQGRRLRTVEAAIRRQSQDV